MPLTMPAAVIGIQSICTAHTVAPMAPNRNRSAISIKPTPCQLKRAYRLRSSQSLVPWPYLASVSWFFASVR